MMRKTVLFAALLLALQTAPSFAACNISGGVIVKLQAALNTVAAMNNGGLFHPSRMWAAVVDREGEVCAVFRNNPDAWPGSRAIALAKAFTANGFSNSILALSTASLYALVQPGGSLYGLNESNPFNPAALRQDVPIPNATVGGVITFGGGVALYAGGQVIGGLGLSGDTSCADHVIAFRMRRLVGLNSTPNSDNIVYATLINPPNAVTNGHPHCLPTDIPPGKI